MDVINNFLGELSPFWSIFSLVILFIILGLSADQVVSNARALAIKLGLPVFILGLVLGVLTSFPEIAVAISAIASNVPNLSMGNLLGGIIVVMGLVLGFSVLLNRGIDNDGKSGFLSLALVYMVFPPLLALKGSLNFFDGLIIIILYIALMWRFYKDSRQGIDFKLSFLRENKIFKELLIVLVGITIVMVAANFIVNITVDLLKNYQLPPYLIGLIFFPIGTNLPEITVALASWRHKSGELSFSNLLSSSILNSLILGILALNKNIKITQLSAHLTTTITILILFILILIFHKSGKRLSRLEGVIILFVYLIFIALQIGYLY